MKNNLLAILVMLIAVVTISSGCYERVYYREHHQHSDRYYHHRHMDPPADVHIDVR
jgi:hypothetical protein